MARILFYPTGLGKVASRWLLWSYCPFENNYKLCAFSTCTMNNFRAICPSFEIFRSLRKVSSLTALFSIRLLSDLSTSLSNIKGLTYSWWWYQHTHRSHSSILTAAGKCSALRHPKGLVLSSRALILWSVIAVSSSRMAALASSIKVELALSYHYARFRSILRLYRLWSLSGQILRHPSLMLYTTKMH